MISVKLLALVAFVSSAAADQQQQSNGRIEKVHKHHGHHHHHGHHREHHHHHPGQRGQNNFGYGPPQTQGWGGGGEGGPPGYGGEGGGGKSTTTVTATVTGPCDCSGTPTTVAPTDTSYPTTTPVYSSNTYAPPGTSDTYAPPGTTSPPCTNGGGGDSSTTEASSYSTPSLNTYPTNMPWYSTTPVSAHKTTKHTTTPYSTSSPPSYSPPSYTTSSVKPPKHRTSTTSSAAPTSTYGGGSGTPTVGSNGLVNLKVPNLSADPQSFVEAHNAYRRMYHAPDLVWDDGLAQTAQGHSNACVWQHTQNNKYGENLAAGQQNIVSVLGDWVNGANEKGKFDPNDSGADCYSHFTQVVWASTKRVGCAIKMCNGMQGLSLGGGATAFWTCEYDPPGNYIGQFKQNVHALKGGAPS